jgi:cell division protein FtsL
METIEKVMLSIMIALIITTMLVVTQAYLEKQMLKEFCIQVGGNYTESSNWITEKASCNFLRSSTTVITTTTSSQNITVMINAEN